ncbi:hypothetical protein D9M71_753860 [compost metagenome]
MISELLNRYRPCGEGVFAGRLQPPSFFARYVDNTTGAKVTGPRRNTEEMVKAEGFFPI